MTASPTEPPRPERLVPSRLKTDTGAGLVQERAGAKTWAAFVGSWALLAFGVVGLFTGGLAIMGVGGFCAEGGPYEIAVHCPDGTALVMNLGFLLIAIGVLLGIFGARGFGPPVHGYAWSLVFGSMGVAFLVSAFAPPAGVSVSWLVCGILFLALALLPAPLLRMGWPRSVFGRRRLDGRSLVVHGLPVRHAAVFAAAWLASVTAGALPALLLAQRFS
ncbi:hypothetical protein [Microbacterium sp. No. 7]|uniref:hypothetical protein n=1 Tax=Microbacterium sp. No. 7 TaxID=1714373 RepID=UPI0006D057BC|nr:hypothetical protein [Microbacterium sp. No. 7]ALJ20087.1 hypothetical protein AOA12_09260 [Microbacterium sp. No. 7]